MKSVRKRGIIVGLMILSGLLAVGYGIGITYADPPPSNPGNPFQAILDKLDQILAAITAGAQDGNHTLRWDQNLPAAQRFVVLAAFNNEAVLDKETGLVWERSPATTTHTWFDARGQCMFHSTGGRKGWRLSSVHELGSLVDPSVPSPGPTLPPGHPFTNIQGAAYWSATANPYAATSDAWGWNFCCGNIFTGLRTSPARVWCVRGPMQESEY